MTPLVPSPDSSPPDIARRAILSTLAGLPLAALLADPRLARAAAEITDTIHITTANGRNVAAALRKPTKMPAPAVMLVHEWWGLNDQIKAVAVDLARQGYLALAVDLFQGRVATDPDDARALTEALKPDEARDTLTSWVQWLSNHPDSTRKTGTIGWCFGGGWALQVSTLAPLDATVVYYGRCDLPVEQLAHLKGPVLGQFGRQDQFITPAMVKGFEKNMKAAGKSLTVYDYESGHAFANPTGANYHQGDAELAWQRTVAFLGKELRAGG